MDGGYTKPTHIQSNYHTRDPGLHPQSCVSLGLGNKSVSVKVGEIYVVFFKHIASEVTGNFFFFYIKGKPSLVPVFLPINVISRRQG